MTWSARMKCIFQTQVKVKAMQAHQERIDRMRMLGEQIVRQYDTAQAIKSDLDDFTRKWQAAYAKLGKNIELFI